MSTAVLIKHKKAEAVEQARLRAEAAERRRREQEKQERAKKRREFLIQKASEHYKLQKFAGFLGHLEAEAAKNGAGAVARMVREMHAILNGLRDQLGHYALEAEIKRLQLYIDDDDEVI